MLDKDKQFEIALRLHHFFEAMMYVELIRSGRKTPVLEFGEDANSYQAMIKKEVKSHTPYSTKTAFRKVPLIHIGIGFFDAEDREDLFWQIQYMLGHETQHARSTVEKDWNAAHQLCLRDACEKLARDVLGKTSIRLVKDSDYDKFFQDLADKGVFINRQMLMNAIHYILNVLEDGRIENIRCRKHPGFSKYRKLFRGRVWMESDLRDKGYPADESMLSAEDRLNILFSDMYSLATCNIHQRGFLSMYGGTPLYYKVKDVLIPEISAAILSRNCKGCMQRGRVIFNELLDDILSMCRTEFDSQAFEEMLKELLAQLSAAIQSAYNDDANSEEEGDGTPSESVFGRSDLALEMDEEEFNQMKEQMEDAGDSETSMAVKVIVKSEKPDEESESTSEGSSSDTSKASDTSEGNEETDENPGEDSRSGGPDAGKASKKDPSESEGDSSDPFKSDEVPDMSASAKANPDVSKNQDSTEINNKPDSCADADIDQETLEKEIEEIMKEAASAVIADAKASEADCRKAEEVAKAASSLSPVQPAKVSLAGISPDEDVNFIEKTRIYKPEEVLPFELENKGRSLNNKVEEMIKNKKSPDQRGMRSGSFDASRAHVLIRGELTCYKKRGTYDKPDVAGYILIDNSGSMGCGEGSTRSYACNAAAIIEEGFKSHMPLKIAAFDAQGVRTVTHEVVKEFDENVIPNLSYNFKILGRSGNGNKDGYSIKVATRQLLARNEKDKILIIMSDGFPTDYSGGYEEGCADVKAAVDAAKKAGIKTIGMYMYHYQCEEDFAAYRGMYGEDCIFAGMDDIEKELERIFKRLFR